SPFVESYGSISKSIHQGGGYTFAVTPLELKLKHLTSFGESGVVAVHNSYDVGGILYSNVAQIEQLGEPGMDFNHINYYFSPNIGLIKSINHTTNQVWELVQCF